MDSKILTVKYREQVTEYLTTVLKINPDKKLINELLTVVIASDFVLDQLRRYPECFLELLRSNELAVTYDTNLLLPKLRRLTHNSDDFPTMEKLLRDFRRREMIRLIWRDILGLAAIEEVMRETAYLADACLTVAVEWLQLQLEQQYGQPCSANGDRQLLQVIAMGKLGGTELNLSSDIDFILCYPESGYTTNPDNKIDNQLFFIKLAKQLSLLLSKVTQEGFVFRVDMRLRPFGDSGPLVMNYISLRDYFAKSARQWERYAFVKARILCGEIKANEKLLRLCQQFTYQETADKEIVQALKEIKVKICRQVMIRSTERNIKIGEGGIREIEFIVQVFQLIYGGREAILQQQNLLQVLTVLKNKQYMDPEVADRLQQAYLMLRKVENRLQAMSDQQEHRLPTNELLQQRIAYSLHYESWHELWSYLEELRYVVSQQFTKVITQPLEEISISKAEAIRSINYQKQLAIHDLIHEWRKKINALSIVKENKIWDPFFKELENEVLKYSKPQMIMNQTLSLLSVLLAQNDPARITLEQYTSKLVKICSASKWLADELTQRPSLVVELLSIENVGLPDDLLSMQKLLQKRLINFSTANGPEAFIDLLNQFKYEYTMRIAVADVLGNLSVMRVSDLLTDLAITVLRQILHWVWQESVAEYGLPKKLDGTLCQLDFIIVAYGKLGGIELGYTSDLDLVFLHDANEDELTNGETAITGAQFFQRLSKRLVELLSVQTSVGRLYRVDTQLKPMGKMGMLVNSFGRFANYQQQNAWTWEHQALVRSRAIAGDEKLAEAFAQLRQKILGRSREISRLRKEVMAMRERMRAEKKVDPECFHIKEDDGGITDIEFMAQFVVLAWSSQQPLLLMFPDNIRIFETCESGGLLSRKVVDVLCDAYRTYRKTIHHLALQGRPAVVPNNKFQQLRQSVKRAWQILLSQ